MKNETRIIEFFNTPANGDAGGRFAPDANDQPPRADVSRTIRKTEGKMESECAGTARTPSLELFADVLIRFVRQARQRAREDREHGVSLIDGLRCFRSAGACELEMRAYTEEFQSKAVDA